MTATATPTTPGFVERVHYSDDSRAVLAALDERIEEVYASVQQLEGWRRLLDPSMSREETLAILREVFRSVYMYQRHTTEAGFLMLGRLPKDEHKLMKTLLLHKNEEAEHGEWALRDYLTLGGRKELALVAPSPATFAVASVWWRMAQVEEPFGYLGAEYLFENLTARVCQVLVASFAERGVPTGGLGFVVEHATEDVKHTNLITHLILDSVTRYPQTGEAIIRCFDYFRQVYPEPVWSEAYERVQRS